IVPAAGIRRCPARPLPSLKSFKLGPLVQGHHEIEFAIGMTVILPTQYVVVLVVLEARRGFAVHIDGSDAEMECLRRRLGNAAAPIVWAGDFVVGSPSFLHPGLYQTREILVQIASFTVLFVEPPLHLGARSHILHFLQERNAALN